MTRATIRRNINCAYYRSADAPTVMATSEKAMSEPRRMTSVKAVRWKDRAYTSSAEYIVRRDKTAQARRSADRGSGARGGRSRDILLILLRPTASGINSVAVLPFANASDDPNMEYLSDGISESLINSLSRLPQLKVIARSSSFKYRDEDVDLQEVAKALGVQAIVTGRVMRRRRSIAGQRRACQTRRDKTQMWGEQYNRKGDGLANAIRKISRADRGKAPAAVDERRAAATRQRRGSSTRRLTRYCSRDVPSEQAITGRAKPRKLSNIFNQALAIDPNYAPAHAALAAAYLDLGYNS